MKLLSKFKTQRRERYVNNELCHVKRRPGILEPVLKQHLLDEATDVSLCEKDLESIIFD